MHNFGYSKERDQSPLSFDSVKLSFELLATSESP